MTRCFVFIRALAACCILFLPAGARAQVAITSTGTPYTQNFDSLANSGTSAALPPGWLLSESGTSARVDGAYTADNGASNAGDTYSYGAPGSTDRALGTLLSSTLTPIIGACFINSTGAAITSLAISYAGEQWRLGQSGRGADHLDFSYNLSATGSITAGAWTSYPGLSFTSPNSVGTVGALDGNLAQNRTAVSGVIANINIPNGQSFCLRWVDFNVTGSDDGLAVDDFSLTATGDTPTGSGSANPVSVLVGGSTTLSASITPAAAPPSTGITVSCDLSQIGGSSAISLLNSGNNVYSASFAIAANVAPASYQLPCAVSDAQSRSSPFNIALTVVLPTSLTLLPAALPDGVEGAAYSQNFSIANGTSCSFAVASGALPPGLVLTAAGVLSGAPTSSGKFSFGVTGTCANGSASQTYGPTFLFACEAGVKTSTAIHTVQGSGAASPLAGQMVEVEGIVVGAFQSSTQLRGFYLQEPDATWDSDPLTSEGVFIFDNGAGASVQMGDRVRVRGTVDEFSSTGSFLGVSGQTSSLTEIGTVINKQVCSSGNTFARSNITLPVASVSDLERYEGMAVQIGQPLTVTGNFSLGATDQIDLAPSVLYTPTISPNQATWPAQTSLNMRSVIALDDGSTLANANLYPTLFPTGGLSDANTLRVGALVNYDAATKTYTALSGVLDDRFGQYRIQPTAPVTFYNANPRPAIAPILSSVGGRFRAVSANVLNFFVTLGSRGAATSTEFDHQKTKVIEALSSMDADVYGLSEVQNFSNGNTSGGTYTNAAVQSLVDGLNCKKAGNVATCASPPTAPYAYVDSLTLGASNGTDAIRSVIIYRPDRLTAVGGPALYYQNDTNRPTLAQTFRPALGMKAASQTFTFVVNHFRSKSSACGGTSDDLYQGNCNGLRLNMATNVVSWLAGNPTGDPGSALKLLLVGDFNAYFGEDPIQYFANHGYFNLINGVIGPLAYSYNFGSQAGYLDHALANAAFNPLIKSVAEWHNNADEPSALEALNSAGKSAAAQIAYYGADPWAASDHDPIVIGFNTLAGDLNDDGVIDAADQALLIANLNRNAQNVDRRMDYDGDGRITLNDYRIWTSYYRAFIQ